jgi:hypothetical protein
MCKSLACIMMLLLIVSAGSCRKANIDSKVFEVLADFAFVGSGPTKLESDGSINRLYVAEHGTEVLSHPKKLQSEVQYIFHHRVPLDDESFALKEFPARLERAGLRIIKAPQSSSDLMALYQGGPLFSFRFTIGSREALFYNQMDPMLGSNDSPWKDEDYILVIAR